jgi:pimeloyl-ACP methyl ester carboxylesterase
VSFSIGRVYTTERVFWLTGGRLMAKGNEGAVIAKTLKVPGASLHYEVHGTGPVLLLIAGGPADASVFARVADVLAKHYTVVTYDPRGNSRSSLDGPPADWQADVHGDDAARLIEAMGGGAAYVFGNSGGALVGLDLAVRHPERVRMLVAHEPPAMELLPDAAAQRAQGQEVYDTYRRHGVGPAMQKFMTLAGLKGGPPPRAAVGQPSPEMIESMARMGRNAELFLAHGLRQAGAFVPDIRALRKGSPRIVVAAGDESEPQLAYRAAVALADRLGTTVVRFPGDHGGFMMQPDAFAAKLHEVLITAPSGGRVAAAAERDPRST